MIDNTRREQANQRAFTQLTSADPVLVDVRRAGDVVPGMTPTTILTSGPPQAWEDYVGPQRNALIYGAIFERLAATEEEAAAKFAADSARLKNRDGPPR